MTQPGSRPSTHSPPRRPKLIGASNLSPQTESRPIQAVCDRVGVTGPLGTSALREFDTTMSFAREGEGPRGVGRAEGRGLSRSPETGRATATAAAGSRHLSKCHLVSAAQRGQAPPPGAFLSPPSLPPPSSLPERSRLRCPVPGPRSVLTRAFPPCFPLAGLRLSGADELG